MRRLLLLLYALFVLGSATAQIRDISSGTANGDLPTLHLHIREASSKAAMPGATITLIPSPGDTLYTATNQYGYATLNPVLKQDSMTVRASYVGYQTQEHRLPARYTSRYEILLPIDSMLISAIVIQGKQIAMIQRGDTTLYNASAFKTMRGDRMGELLKQLPGVEIRGDKLYASGEEVSMILINGAMLFGRNTKAAMELIRSDNVERVRVYDQHAADRLIEQDTLQAKERVMDIQTKKPVRQVSELQLTTAAGAYLGSDAQGDHAAMGSAVAMYRRYAEKKMGINFVGNAGYNMQQMAQPVLQPSRGADLTLALNHNKVRQHQFTQSLSFSTRRDDKHTSNENRYDDPNGATPRTTTTDNVDQEGNLQIHYGGGYTRKIGRRGTMRISASADYERDRTQWHHTTINDMPEGRYGTDVGNHDHDAQYGVHAGMLYRQLFKKPKRSFQLSLNYDYSNLRGDGWRVDTAAMSTQHQWMTSRLREQGGEFRLRADYSEPIAKRWSYNTSLMTSFNSDRSEQLAWDELLQQRDSVNTHHYTYRHLYAWFSHAIEYANKDRSFTSRLSLTYDFTRIRGLEQFPDNYRQQHAYSLWKPAFTLNYRKKSVRLTVRYTERGSTPALEQLRANIDDSSPLYLTVGNPDLEQPLTRSAQVTLNLTRAKQALSLEFNGTYSFTANQIVNRILLFPEATYLPEYDYTTVAGASLYKPVNVDGGRNFTTRLALAKKSNALKATFRLSADHLYLRNPFYQNTTLSINDSHTANLTVQYISNFSRHVELTLRNTFGKGWHNRDGAQLYESINETVGATLRVNFLKRWWIQGDGSYAFSDTTREGMRNEQTILNLSLSCKFGKEDRGEVSLSGNDLLNRTRNLVITSTDDYIRVSRTDQFGRSVYLKVGFRF